MTEVAQQLVVAAVLVRDGRVLLCRRPLAKRHGGLWELPGGKVHAGESDEAALRRELAEELGLELERAGETLAEIADPGSPFVVRFLRADARGEPEAREHLAVEWVAIAAAPSYPLAPSDRGFFSLGLVR